MKLTGRVIAISMERITGQELRIATIALNEAVVPRDRISVVSEGLILGERVTLEVSKAQVARG